MTNTILYVSIRTENYCWLFFFSRLFCLESFFPANISIAIYALFYRCTGQVGIYDMTNVLWLNIIINRRCKKSVHDNPHVL